MQKIIRLIFCYLGIILLLSGSQLQAQTGTVVLKAPPGFTQFTDSNANVVTPDALGHVTVQIALVEEYLHAGFKYYDLYILRQAPLGDMVLVVSPANLTTAHGSAATRTVTVTLQDAAGETHTWFTQAVPSGVGLIVNSSAGTASIPSTTLTFVNGVASVTITEGGTWAAADTDTLAVAAQTLFGTTVEGVNSVETMD